MFQIKKPIFLFTTFRNLQDFDPLDPKGEKKPVVAAAATKKPKKKKGKDDDLSNLLDVGLKIGKGKKK